jgi:hypothetical protein
MYEHTHRASAYRQRAEKLRAIAPRMKDEASRKVLFKIADNFDRLALVQDQLAALRP